MTGPAPGSPAGQPAPRDLTALVFRALYQGFDVHTVGVLYVVVPKGSMCLSGPSLGAIARQISDHEHPAPAAPQTPASIRPAS
jgi:hypothetical protein